MAKGGFGPAANGIFARAGRQRRADRNHVDPGTPRCPDEKMVFAISGADIEPTEGGERRGRHHKALITERDAQQMRPQVGAARIPGDTPRSIVTKCQIEPTQPRSIIGDEASQRWPAPRRQPAIGMQKPQPATTRLASPLVHLPRPSRRPTDRTRRRTHRNRLTRRHQNELTIRIQHSGELGHQPRPLGLALRQRHDDRKPQRRIQP